ncbi:hypothetical protein FPZ24_02155 [Sphingomonas panacisoli]|uniref:Uncharacterized protein n=1 Tax=Sphingomonas panacisoli TaxID=1813879 RepID=A0A5B8LFC7_9SPHN|nr:hypothetical protein [Sphingomonas panacisoli]QDZ06424.1 hypothetical protein FPZ24_02155 [Sphingomonas panacisoli]
MAQHAYAMVIHDASLIDVAELSADVPPQDLTVVQPVKGDDSHNELATIVILALAPIPIAAFTAWALKKTASELVEYRVTIRRPDGTEMDVYLKINRRSSEAPDAQVIKQIAEALRVPESAIVNAAGV